MNKENIDKTMMLRVRKTHREEGEGKHIDKAKVLLPCVAQGSGDEEGEVWKETRERSVSEAFLRDSH